jgi:ABC-type Fe3+ transport system permease subunit
LALKLIRRITGALVFQLDTPLTLLLLFSLAVFIAILVMPLITLLARPAIGISMDVVRGLLAYPYVVWPPLGEWIIGVDRGDHKLIILRFKDMGVILNTLAIAFSVTVLATVVGVLVAYVSARYEFPGRALLRILALVPLLYTPFVNAFVAYKIFGDNGILYNTMVWLNLGYALEVTYIAGVIIAQTMMFWPIVYLNTLAALLQIDPSLEEQAENMGARGFKLFRSVTLPLSLPGIAAGAGLVFIFSMEDLAAPIAFKVDRVVSREIVKAIVGSRDIEALSVEVVILAGLLLTSALLWFIAVKHYVSLRHYAMIVRGGRWKPRVAKPGLPMYIAIYFAVFPIVIFSMLPQLGVLVYAFSESWFGVLPSGFTLDHFRELLRDPNVVNGLRNSVVYSTIAITLIVVTSTTIAYIVSRVKVTGVGVLDVLATSPLAIPGLSIALGLVILYSLGPFKDSFLDPFRNPAVLIALAYAVRKGPFTTRAVYAGLQQVHQTLEEAGMNMGASRFRVLFTIVLPLIGLNVMAGAIVSFVYCMTEVSTSIVLGALNPEQAPVTYVIYEYVTAGYGGGAFIHLAAAIVALTMALQILAITISNYILRFRYAFLGV